MNIENIKSMASIKNGLKYILVLILALNVNAAWAQPPNDDPCFAIDLGISTDCNTAGFPVFTNQGATGSSVADPACTDYQGGDVWFQVTVPAGGAIEINMEAGIMTDGGLAVYTGTCGALTEIDCDDDSGPGLMPKLELSGLTPNSVVFIRVWEYGNNNNGTFGICITTPPPPPVNDEACSAIMLTAENTCNFATFSNASSTGSNVPDPGCANYEGGDVWFEVIVPAGGALIFNTQAGIVTDGGMAIYSGNCNSLTLIECDDDDGDGLMPSITASGLTPGSSVLVRFWEFGNDNNGSFGICIRIPPPPPVNDEPCSAAVLIVDPNACNFTQFTNESATGTTTAPPPGCAGYSGSDVWFQAVVPAGGAVLVNTQAGVMTDAGMAIYSGTCDNLTLLACNDDGQGNADMPTLSQGGLTPGSTVWIRVWENGNNNNGTFGICVTIPPPPPTNDEPCTATPLTVDVNCVYTSHTNAQSTGSAGAPAPGCGGYSGSDVWFTAVVPSTGNLLIRTQSGTMTDAAMALYTGSDCGSLTLVTCNDDGQGNADMPIINQTGLTPGSTVWIRVWENGNNNNGTFEICVTIPPIVAPPNICAQALPMCSSNQYLFPSVTGQVPGDAPGGGVYGCLSAIPNQIWYYLEISTNGNLVFGLNQAACTGTGIDVDYVVWGPFNSLADGCTGIASSNIVSCSFSPAPTETITINNAQAGQFYILLITNYNSGPGLITVQQNSGTGVSAPSNCTTGNACNLSVSNSGPLCSSPGSPQTILLQASTVSCAIYTWTGPNGFTATGQNVVVTPPTAPGNYVYTMTVSFNGLPATCVATTTVVVNDKPDLGADKTVTICSGGTADLTTQFNTTGLTTSWTFGGVTVPDPTSVSASGVYELIASAGSCSDTAQVTIAFGSVTGTASVTNATCTQPGTITLTAASGTQPFTYVFNGNPPQSSNTFTGDPGTYTYTATDALGCTFSGSIDIELTDDLTLSGITDPSICKGQSVVLATTGNATNFSWSPATDLSDPTSASPTADPENTTTYTLTAYAGYCPPKTYTVTVNVDDAPVVEAGDPVSIQLGASTTLNASVISSTGTLTYLWNNAQSLSSPSILNPVANPSQTTMYVLTVTNNTGCSGQDSVLVTVVAQCINVRNAFTPNGDGINDFWLVYDDLSCLQKVTARVYNRYGNKVFESLNYQNKWDGRYQNKPVPDGTYYGVLEFTLATGRTVVMKTDITILR